MHRFIFALALLFACGSARAVIAQRPGTLEAESVLLRLMDEVEVPARAAGVLTELQVRTGDVVKADALLAKVDDFQSDLHLARAELEWQVAKAQLANDVLIRTARTEFRFAQQSYERLRRAAEKLPGSVSEVDLADLDLKQRQAELKVEDAERMRDLAKATERVKAHDVLAMRRRVEIGQVRAPFGGTIEHLVRKRGEWVEPGEKIARIISLRRLRAEGFVATDGRAISLKGAKVVFRAEGDKTGKPHTGTVVFVHAELDPVNRRQRFWAEIDNAGKRLRPGMRGKLTIELPGNGKDGA